METFEITRTHSYSLLGISIFSDRHLVGPKVIFVSDASRPSFGPSRRCSRRRRSASGSIIVASVARLFVTTVPATDHRYPSWATKSGTVSQMSRCGEISSVTHMCAPTTSFLRSLVHTHIEEETHILKHTRTHTTPTYDPYIYTQTSSHTFPFCSLHQSSIVQRLLRGSDPSRLGAACHVSRFETPNLLRLSRRNSASAPYCRQRPRHQSMGFTNRSFLSES